MLYIVKIKYKMTNNNNKMIKCYNVDINRETNENIPPMADTCGAIEYINILEKRLQILKKRELMNIFMIVIMLLNTF